MGQCHRHPVCKSRRTRRVELSTSLYPRSATRRRLEPCDSRHLEVSSKHEAEHRAGRPSRARRARCGGCSRSSIEIAPTPLPILLLGETGSGKEVAAEWVHRHSGRPPDRFLRLNCSALSESVVESELFGHERGAFTGAVAARPGIFEAAHEGIALPRRDRGAVAAHSGEAAEGAQSVRSSASAARNRAASTCGSSPRPTATSPQLIQNGQFREDLYFRLNGMTLHIPRLRDRPSEILPHRDALRPPGGAPAETRSADARREGRHRAHAARLAGQHPRASQRDRTGRRHLQWRHAARGELDARADGSVRPRSRWWSCETRRLAPRQNPQPFRAASAASFAPSSEIASSRRWPRREATGLARPLSCACRGER